MDITPLIPKGKKILSGYGPGFFKVNGEQISGSIIITSESVIKLDITDISDIKLSQILEKIKDVNHLEVILIGTGKKHIIPQKSFYDKAISGVEIMSTDAACRTYNVLLSEGREVAALLVSP